MLDVDLDVKYHDRREPGHEAAPPLRLGGVMVY